MRRRLEEAILELIDVEKWERAKVSERAELKAIREIASWIGKVMGASDP